MILNYYKVHPSAHGPVYGTEDAACFDIRASILKDEKVKIFNKMNEVNEYLTKTNLFTNYIIIMPGERALIPTNIIFDIPQNYSIRLHPRSGLAVKNGIALANCEGIVDSDYVEPTFIVLHNTSDQEFIVSDGDRICQGEIVPVLKTDFWETSKRPTQKTDRVGGFGSTGVK